MNELAPELILGTAQLITSYGVTRNFEDRNTVSSANDLLAIAMREGINTLDTAPAYGDAEAIIGQCPFDFKVHTKLSYAKDSKESLANSLSQLGRQEIDVLYVHDLSVLKNDSNQLNEEFKQLKNLGAKELGVSIYEPSDLKSMSQITEISVVQVPLNLLDHRFCDFIREKKFRTYVRSAFLQGVLLADPIFFRPEISHLAVYVEELRKAVAEQGLTMMEAALSFVIHSGASGVIIGCQSANELDEIRSTWTRVISDSIYFDLPSDFDLPPSEFIDPRTWK